MESVQQRIKRELIKAYISLAAGLFMGILLIGMYSLGRFIYGQIYPILEIKIISALLSTALTFGIFFLTSQLIQKLLSNNLLNAGRNYFEGVISYFMVASCSFIITFLLSEILNTIFGTVVFKSWESTLLLFFISYTGWIIFNIDYDK